MASLRLRLTFPPDLITEPIIHNIGHQYNVVTSIRRADVTSDEGWVILEVQGDADELEGVVEHLKNMKVQVEPVEGDVVQ